MCGCVNPNVVMEKLEFTHNPDGKCLFIDTSKTNLKTLQLYNGNKTPSILQLT